jgi:hypothetical protein
VEPGGLERLTEARYFAAIHYLALVCGDEELALLPHLIAGYEGEQVLTPLTPRERAALWPGLLATQLFLTQFYAKKGDQQGVDRNLRALVWIREHRDDIRRLMEGTSR